MMRSSLQRLALLPILLLLINFGAFFYARFGRWVQASRNPYTAVGREQTPLFTAYSEYLRSAWCAGFGEMPTARGVSILEAIQQASTASLGLLGIAFVISIVVGFFLGLLATRSNPAGVRSWLIPIITIGMAAPSFYIGALLIGGSVYAVLLGISGKSMPIPISGFGWDKHLIFPTVALSLLPTLKIAQATCNLLAGEFNKQYVVAHRSQGQPWQAIRSRLALKNVLAPLILLVAGNLRWLAAELILIETLFNWPGVGRMLANSLMAPQIAAVGRTAQSSPAFLNPPLVATILTFYALLYLLVDLIASIAARSIDPRLRIHAEEAQAD